MDEARARTAALAQRALKTFYRHARIDIAHGRELEKLIDSLPLTPSDMRLLAVSPATCSGSSRGSTRHCFTREKPREHW